MTRRFPSLTFQLLNCVCAPRDPTHQRGRTNGLGEESLGSSVLSRMSSCPSTCWVRYGSLAIIPKSSLMRIAELNAVVRASDSTSGQYSTMSAATTSNPARACNMSSIYLTLKPPGRGFQAPGAESLGHQLCNESQSPTISGAVRALSGAAWSTKLFNI